MKEHWIKRTMYVVVTMMTIVVMIVAALNYFAKQKTVNLLDRRLELAIEDDRVFQAEQDVDWMKQQTTFERRKESKTIAEAEMIERAKEKVAKFKRRREQKQQAYEQAK